ncbi:hypothetical protein [Mesorhizobium sp. WSM4313]|uniref:hypothetical protein n=1 Tax=Mesorhizobium sp. WSM4313 TaxID=2029412 RepID=UPI00159714C8|nr:hypothetical protein [Mesorhizobium sp. WSM4313]
MALLSAGLAAAVLPLGCGLLSVGHYSRIASQSGCEDASLLPKFSIEWRIQEKDWNLAL